MKTKFYLAFLMLAAACISCDKPVLTTENPPESQVKAVARSVITVTENDAISAGRNIIMSPNQLIVRFDPNLTKEQRETIRAGFPLRSQPEYCSCGDTNIELWTIDATILGIEGEVSSIPRRGGGRVEGDRNFQMELKPIPGFVPKDKDANSVPFISYPVTTTVNVAVIDTGLDYMRSKADLYGTAELQDCYKTDSGWNFVDDNNNIMDYHGHGSAVTGIIKSELDANDIDYRILPLKVFDNNGRGSYWDVVCAFGYIKEIQKQGGRIDIVNTSFGGAMQEVADHVILKGIIEDISDKSLIITSAGNAGVNTDLSGSGHFLSSYTSDNLVAVGGYKWVANNPFGSRNETIQMATLSNYGPISIDLAAPFSDNYTLEANNVYLLEGTSFAAAYVSGVAATIAGNNSKSKPAVLKTQVLGSARSEKALIQKISRGRAILKE